LKVKYCVRDVALLKHVLVFTKFEDRFPRTHIGEKSLGSNTFLADFPKAASFGSTNFTYQFHLTAARHAAKVEAAHR
jgi:hypothetical protein